MSLRFCAIVLAAGEGRRMGQDKALMDLGGRTALQRVAAHCAAADLDVLVVRRRGAQDVPGSQELRKVIVQEPLEMMDSLRAGLRALSGSCPGALIFPVDYAMVEPDTLRAVRAALEGGSESLVLPLFHERPGHPIGLSIDLVPEVLDSEAGTLRDVIRRDPSRVGVVPVADPWILRDLDRPEDLQAARAALAPPSAGS